jgi:hypothetical protein
MNLALAAVALFLLVCLALFVRTGYRIMKGQDRMRLSEMVKIFGKTIRAPVSHAEALAAGQAGRRCMMCASQERCDQWLKDPKGEPDFCPNRSYISELPKASK